MKLLVRTLLVLMFFHLSFGAYLVAKCNFDAMRSKVHEVEDGFVYIKSHDIEYTGRKDNNKHTYKVLFTSGKIYKIAIHDENKAERMIVTLYDQKDKEIFSNYVPATHSYFSSIMYDCKQTGMYYLGFKVQDGASGCGIASLSFKRSR